MGDRSVSTLNLGVASSMGGQRASTPPFATGSSHAAEPHAAEPHAAEPADWVAPSWDEIVRQHADRVYRLAYRLSGNRSDAEDLTQETFARAFASLHRFAGRSSARTWLLSIARRVCADAIRTRRPSTPVADLEPPGRAADPADTVSLRLLLDGLDAPFREAFVLTQVLGMPYAEAAEVVGCPVGTIRSRVARARDALVAGLGEGGTRAVRGAG
jgi:RNA polymerase sigma-70 factor (ECF subfamily)